MPSDDADLASEHEQQLLELAMRGRKPVRELNGYCNNCEALLINGGAYCDDLCQEDHEDRQKAQAMRGRE